MAEPYTIVRSNRKTIALVIDREAKLVVRAPYRVKDKVIASFIKEKEQWILEKQRKLMSLREKHIPLLFADGESIMYLGNTLKIIRRPLDKIIIDDTSFYIPLQFSKIDIVDWLKGEARNTISQRAAYYADLMGVSFKAVKISEAKSRWGSCSAKDSLNFAWRLIMCPLPAIDYIVVHELSHIEYKNHGKLFWARVKNILPNYQEQQAWLKANHLLMQII